MRTDAHRLQAECAKGVDLILRLDLEVTESKRVLEPLEVELDVLSDPKLVDRDILTATLIQTDSNRIGKLPKVCRAQAPLS